MKFFAQGARRLADLSLPMRLSVTFFVVFVLLGLASSIALQHQQTGFSAGRTEDYYRGNEDDPDPEVMHVEKSYRQLLETAHFHLFIMPVVYLALVHLYFLADRPEAEKVAMTVVVFGGLLLEVALPWLVRFAGPGWTPLFWVSGLAITIPTVWICGVCLREMWRPVCEAAETGLD